MSDDPVTVATSSGPVEANLAKNRLFLKGFVGYPQTRPWGEISSCFL